MDLATRTLDFARALSDLSVRGNSIIDGGTMLVQWLARERIDDREFCYCMETLSNKAAPNTNGSCIQRSLQNADSRSRARKFGSLALGVSGSVGRMIACSPEHAYLVTTVAAIMEYHDVIYAEKAISNMVLDTSDHKHGIVAPYDIRRVRIKPVVEKVVDSIALTIVKSGHTLEGLPEELKHICPHTTGYEVFAATVSTIQRHEAPSVVLSMDVLYADITLWFLSHWNGALEIVVKGKLVYTCAFSHDLEQKRMTILVATICDPDSNEHQYGINARIEVSLDNRGKLDRVLRTGNDADPVRGSSSPTTRFPLYDLSRLGKPTVTAMLNRSTLNAMELNQVKATAQAMAKWLLSLPLKSSPLQDTSAGSQYSGFLLEERGKTSFTVAGALSHWPTINRGNFGVLPEHMIIYKGGAIDPAHAGYHAQAGVKPEILDELGAILDCFPPATTLLDMILSRCGCEGCKHEVEYGKSKPGCLRETAVTTLFTLLGHVIADGFGIPDASGIGDPESLKMVVAKLLHEVAIFECVLWDTWFTVACTVYLGCDWTKANFSANEGASNVVAVQYGSLVVAAKWIDITANNPTDGCFGVKIADGQLSGLSDDFAVVQAERNSPAPTRTIEVLPDSDWSKKDDCLAVSETHIIGSAGYIYQLLTLVKSGGYVRTVDPSAAMWNRARSMSPTCDHSADNTENRDTSTEIMAAWSFTELLGEWDPADWDDKKPWVTKVLDSHLKCNVAMSLAARDVLLMGLGCCLNCAIKAVMSAPQGPMLGSSRSVIGFHPRFGTLART